MIIFFIFFVIFYTTCHVWFFHCLFTPTYPQHIWYIYTRHIIYINTSPGHSIMLGTFVQSMSKNNHVLYFFSSNNHKLRNTIFKMNESPQGVLYQSIHNQISIDNVTLLDLSEQTLQSITHEVTQKWCTFDTIYQYELFKINNSPQRPPVHINY